MGDKQNEKENILFTIRPSPHALEQKDGLNIFSADDYSDDHAKSIIDGYSTRKTDIKTILYKKNLYITSSFMLL